MNDKRTRYPDENTKSGLHSADPETIARIAKSGGDATLKKHGRAHFRTIGKLGGAAIAKRGPDYFRRIGRIGGNSPKHKRAGGAKQ